MFSHRAIRTYEVRLTRNDGSMRNTSWFYRSPKQSMEDFVSGAIKFANERKDGPWSVDSIRRID